MLVHYKHIQLAHSPNIFFGELQNLLQLLIFLHNIRRKHELKGNREHRLGRQTGKHPDHTARMTEGIDGIQKYPFHFIVLILKIKIRERIILAHGAMIQILALVAVGIILQIRVEIGAEDAVFPVAPYINNILDDTPPPTIIEIQIHPRFAMTFSGDLLFTVVVIGVLIIDQLSHRNIQRIRNGKQRLNINGNIPVLILGYGGFALIDESGEHLYGHIFHFSVKAYPFTDMNTDFTHNLFTFRPLYCMKLSIFYQKFPLRVLIII